MQVYTVHDLHPFLADEIVRRGAGRSGLTWHYGRPPVRELEYEMDCRGVATNTWCEVGIASPVTHQFDDASASDEERGVRPASS